MTICESTSWSHPVHKIHGAEIDFDMEGMVLCGDRK